MSEQADLERFAVQLLSDVRDTAHGVDGAADFHENAFTQIVLDYLAEIGMIEDAQPVFFEAQIGRGIGRLNAYGFNEDGDTLDVFASIYAGSSSLPRIARDEVVTATDRALRVCQAALEGVLERQVEPASDAYAMSRRLSEARAAITKVRVFILTDGRAQLPDQDSRSVCGIPVRVELWDVERLFRGMQAELPRAEIDIDFERDYGGAIPCLVAPAVSSEFKAFLLLLPGEVLYRLYEEYGARLLELNVRSFLSARGKVNAGIRKTLRDEPHRFLAYNNGIVLTVDALELTSDERGHPAIKSVRGLQVVNGGQTTASIHLARKGDKVDVSAVLVPAKLTVIDPACRDEIVSSVSRYANTQNVIQVADLSANDRFHVEIERLSREVWCPGEQGRWFYERARGQYQEAKSKAYATITGTRRFNTQTPPARKFTKTDLAKFVNSWLQKPNTVSYGSQKNFDSFMQDLASNKGRDWVPNDVFYRQLIAQAIVFRTAERLVRQAAFAAYRANIVTYLVALLSCKSDGVLDLTKVWERQSVSGELESLMRTWAFLVNAKLTESAGGRNVTEWCKKPACWEAVRELELDLPSELPIEFEARPSLAPSRRSVPTSVSDDDVERCRMVDRKTWMRLHTWGVRTGILQRWQADVAHTLANYAANRWIRSPTAKQARHGVKILEIAAEHGQLQPDGVAAE